MTFIDRLVLDLHGKYGERLNELAVVFPSRRAGLFFRKGFGILAQHNKRPIWSPEIFSLDDFVCRLSSYRIIDTTTLLFRLFGIYKGMKSCSWTDFGEFYSWGVMILSDFDEIDRHLINTGSLFKGLKSFKDTCNIDIDESNNLYKRYTDFWGDMEELYDRLTRKLKSEGYVYGGMAYRDAVERIKDSPVIKWSNV